jgi:hypothetical protein
MAQHPVPVSQVFHKPSCHSLTNTWPNSSSQPSNLAFGDGSRGKKQFSVAAAWPLQLARREILAVGTITDECAHAATEQQ